MEKDTTLKVLGLKQFTNQEVQFYANTISNHLATSHMHIHKPHKHDFYATFLFTNGSGTHEIDFNSYEVKPNVVFVLSPGQTHSWQLSEDVEGIIFFHSQEFYEAHYLHNPLSEYSFFSNVNNQAAIYLDGNLETVPVFEKILAVSQSQRPKKEQLLLSLISQIYIELEDRANSSGSKTINEHGSYYLKFLKFRKLVDENFTTEKSVKQYSQWMNLTPKHLNRINKLIVNKTTSEVIADRLILEAKRILIFGDKNFAQVADELGFPEYSHFSKMFKMKTGKTPSEFSKSYS